MLSSQVVLLAVVFYLPTYHGWNQGSFKMWKYTIQNKTDRIINRLDVTDNTTNKTDEYTTSRLEKLNE